MTAPQAAIQTSQSEARRAGEAAASGGPAQSQRRSGAGPADELAFLALLASNLGVASAPVPAAAIGRDRNAAASGKTGPGPADPQQPREPGRAGASAEALTRSQADVLRTVGRGVSLSALAQAQLQGRTPGSYVRASDHASEALRGDHATDAKRGPRAEPHEPTRAEPHSPDPLATPRQPAASPSRDANGTGSNPTPTTAGSTAAASTEANDASRHGGRNADPPTPRGDRAAAPPTSSTAPAAGTPGGNAAPAPTNASPGTPSQGAPPVAVSSVARAGATAAPSKLAPPRPTPTDRQGVINQANRALGLALRAKDGSVRFNLAPDHLGSLRVELTRSEHGVSARFEAASRQAREILESSIEHLRASLEARGLRVDRLEVRVAEAGGPERGGAPTPRPAGSEHPDAGESAEHGSDPDAERGQDGGHDRQPGSGAWADRGTDAGAPGSVRWSREQDVGGAEPPSGDRTRVAGMVRGYAPWSDADGVALVEIVV